jgi:predicted membrane protein
LDEQLGDKEKPQSLRSLLTRPVVISVANYAVIGLLEMMAGVLIPLVWSTAIEFGGLGMSPASIGVWMASYGFLNGIFQFVGFPHIVERFGPRRVFIFSIASFFPMYLMLLFENLALRYVAGGAAVTAVLIILQLSSIALSDMGFSKLFATRISNAYTESYVNSCRRGIYVCIFLCSQQAISGRHKRPCADGGLNSKNCGTGRGRIVVCLFPQ